MFARVWLVRRWWPGCSARRRLRRVVPLAPSPAMTRARQRWVTACSGAVVAAAARAGAVYGGAAAYMVCARRRDRESSTARTAAVDALSALAADLRAGLTPLAALAEAEPALRSYPDPVVSRANALVAAAWGVGERLGAPLSTLLDRADLELGAVLC